MANNNNNGNGKRNVVGGPDGPQTQMAKPSKAPDNIFSRHGNQQISQVIHAAQEKQQAPETLLSSMVDQETEVDQTQSWWKDDAQIREEEEQIVSAKKEPELQGTTRDRRIGIAAAEKMLVAQAALRGESLSQADLANATPEKLTSREKVAMSEMKKLEAAGNATEQAAMLALANARNMDDQDKAQMLIRSDLDIEQADLVHESGRLQALMAAQQLPGQLGDLDVDAASMVAQKPLDERQTLRNITDEIRLISEQIHRHPSLLDPNASVEQKSTALIQVLAYQLDVATRESLAVHPFTSLTQDLIFDPMAMMEVNRVAGSSRDIRQMGSFAVILWQMTTDESRLRLDSLGDDTLINEQDFLSSTLTGMANRMYIDALADPGW